VDIAAKTRNGTTVVSARSIAETQGISENYLEQILAQLKEHGLVVSVRGAGGGFKLSRGDHEITAGDVLRAVEGSLSPAECLDEPKLRGGKKANNAGCTSCDNCSAKGVIIKLFNSINEVVDAITILDILDNKIT